MNTVDIIYESLPNLLFGLIFAVPSVAIFWRLYAKAGVPGRNALFPYLNQRAMGEIAEHRVLGAVMGVLNIFSWAIGFSSLAYKPEMAAFFVVVGILDLLLILLFIKKYDANLLVWVLVIILPFIGIFLVDSIIYKGNSLKPHKKKRTEKDLLDEIKQGSSEEKELN